MTFSPEMLNLAAMLDDPDNDVAVNVLAGMLAREDELGDLPAYLQESPDPLVRRRAHMLQNAITMRLRRRRICTLLNEETYRDMDVFAMLAELHLLWFDKDHPDEVSKDIRNFLEMTEKFPLYTLTDGEMMMRKLNFLPENETTIRPESYCIGTVLYHRLGASSVIMAMLWQLLGREKFRLVQYAGEFGIMDEKNNLLLGGNSWRMTVFDGKNIEFWNTQMIMRYIASALLSCAVNSDSYRYVMSIVRALTGDESEHIFDGFPYPFDFTPGNETNEQQL